MQTKPAPYLKVLLTASVLAVVSVVLATASAQAATLSGKIFEGKSVLIYNASGVPTTSPLTDINGVAVPVLESSDPDLAKPEYATAVSGVMAAVTGAQVMVRDFASNAFVANGTVAANDWSATVPDGGSYVVLFSAPGYDATSRQFDNVTGAVSQFAYLAKLNAGNTHKPGNMLVEVFRDNKVNGAVDAPNIDPPINGVSVTVCSDAPTPVCKTGITGSQAVPIVLENQMAITDMNGMYYFTNLAPGNYTITATPGAAFGPYYQTSSPDGGFSQGWAVTPGDLGIMIMPQMPMPEALVAIGFVPKKGDFPPAPTNTFATVEGIEAGKPLAEVSGTFEFTVNGVGAAVADVIYVDGSTTVESLVAAINAQPGNPGVTAALIPGGQKTGISLTANAAGTQIAIIKNDTIAVFVQTVAPGAPGNTLSGSCSDLEFMPEIGMPGVPIFVFGENHPGTSQNDPVLRNNCFVIASPAGNTGGVLATTEADANGNWIFNNVPAGNYTLVGNSLDLHYIWHPANVAVQAGQFTPPVNIGMPKFFGTLHGTVRDAGGLPLEGALVQARYKNGTVLASATTGADGTYTIDGLPEIEAMGQVDVALAGYRGVMRTEAFDPDSPSLAPPMTDVYNTTRGAVPPHCLNCDPAINVTFDASHRYALWFAMRYQADFYLEQVTTGNISGVVYNDTLDLGTWTGNGAYDSAREAVVPGATVKLYDAAGALVDTKVAGVFPADTDPAGPVAQGWMKSVKPYTEWPDPWMIPEAAFMPLDNFGGVYVGPMPGFYEFRDVAPGTYRVEVTADGYAPTSSTHVVPTSGVVANLGVAAAVPLSGELEGGVWDDLVLDPNLTSLIFDEKMALAGSPVGAYDQFGYRLGTGVMGNPLCWPNVNTIPDPVIGPAFARCPAGQALDGPIEMEAYFAPGVRYYLGNDPCLAGGYNGGTNTHEPLFMPDTVTQGGKRLGDGWAMLKLTPAEVAALAKPITCRGAGLISQNAPLPPAPLPPPTIPPAHGDVMRVTGITGSTGSLNGTGYFKQEGTKWYGSALVNVKEQLSTDPLFAKVVSGARITAAWVLTGAGQPTLSKSVTCTTNASGQCTFRSETVEKTAYSTLTLKIGGITVTDPAVPAYNAAAPSISTFVRNKP